MTADSFPLVSIGIPTYNRADGYLRECIESAIQQTYPNIEIIISDNCSSDDTGKVVASYESPRIKYFRHSTNIGPTNNFNYCLEQSRGAYFLLLHDDDKIDADFVATCMEAAGYQTDAGLILTGSRLIDSGGRSLKEMPNNVFGSSMEDLVFSWFAHKTALYLCSTLFNTAFLKAIGGFSSRHNLFLDVFAEMKLAASHGRVDVAQVKASFRHHEGELTHTAKVKAWCEDSLDLLDLICDLATEQKKLIRHKGLRFFCDLNFKRAMAVATFTGRLGALFAVLNQFGYRLFALRRFVHCLRVSAREFLTPSKRLKSKVGIAA